VNDDRNDMLVGKLLLDLSDNVLGRTARRLDGLTDGELLWEPAPHCWSVRERPTGSVRADWAPYIGDAEVTDTGSIRSTGTDGDARRPPPFTNLAWRIWHLTVVYGRRQTDVVLTSASSTQDDGATPNRTAGAALADLHEAHGRWRAILASLTHGQLEGSSRAFASILGAEPADAVEVWQ
jgi:DinB superfamily